MNTSLRNIIACFGDTNMYFSRQHQLRVHLKFLGFPILNDALYGGVSDEFSEDMEKDAVGALRSLATTHSDVEILSKKFGNISDNAASAAKEMCLICQGKYLKKFNSSQLLAGGHCIDLHATTYTITFEKKKGKQRSSEGDMDIIGTLECTSNGALPDWCGA